jgi:uncharacterized protein (DUF362 family)
MKSEMSGAKVVTIRSPEVWTPAGRPDEARLQRMIVRGFELLTGRSEAREGVLSLFTPDDRIGIKINTIGGKALSTRPETALSLGLWLSENGIPERNIILWDRTNRELRDAGFRLSTSRSGIRIFGTDEAGAGYGTELVAHGEVGSLFSTIQTDLVTASISLAILKDHGLAGVTAGMKNYFGAVHNPNKYHDAPPVKPKHRLTVIDALLVQYHRGPSYHPQWAEKAGALIFSLDPVAADRVGWDLIENLRAARGLPTLEEEGRKPLYLATAEKMGLGRSTPDAIETIVEEI